MNNVKKSIGHIIPTQYEIMARKYIEKSGGLFDLYQHELASPLYHPKEVEGAVWILKCLTNPENRTDLDALIVQSNLRCQEFPERI